MIDQITNNLLQYGTLGIFCIYLMWDKITYQKEQRKHKAEMKTIIQNNTIALTKFCDRYTN